MLKLKEYAEKNPDKLYFAGIILLSIVFLFVGLGSFPLMDVDETRYAIMARDMLASGDWNDLMLNNVPFLEKPPLYFWLVASSVKFFGSFNPFTVRFPIALMSFALVLATYFLGKKTINAKFGFFSSSILLSSFFFILLSHIAILDNLITVLIGLALYSGFYATICSEKNKKYFWIAFYLAMGVGVLAKGILAVGIPCVVMFIYCAITKNLKEMFKPAHVFPGLILFFIIAAPWHVVMHKNYGGFFWHEYFIRHHFARLINSETIGRDRPLLFFVPVFLGCFMPWTLMFLQAATDGIISFINKLRNKTLFSADTIEQKLLMFTTISFLFIFILFSSSSTKLPTYILPAFPFAAILTGHFFLRADKKEKQGIIFKISAIIFVIAFITVIHYGTLLHPENSPSAFWTLKLLSLSSTPHISEELYNTFLSTINLSLVVAAIGLIISTKMIFFKKAKSSFIAYIVIMILLSWTAFFKVGNFIYQTGEKDLVDFSKYCAQYPDSKLITFDIPVKPSIKMYYQDNVDFLLDYDTLKLEILLKQYKDKKVFIVVKEATYVNLSSYYMFFRENFDLVSKGFKYTLYTPKNK